ncbi:hypothetical protein [Zooshikella ganghwensis]|uniref:hypothetical protein n=1 Tax=Zooshikella ganghwensis TaxID=202772 RepID=UPI001058568E|nr:hypothetical protein [Zooshikella ganghwensis]
MPLAALIATLGSAFLSIMVFTIYLNYWFEITVLPIVSFFFVLCGGLVAPKGKILIALMLAMLTSILTYFFWGISIHPTEYKFTYSPLISINTASYISVVCVALIKKYKFTKLTNTKRA